MLRTVFVKLCSKFHKDTSLIDQLWDEINKAYSKKNRHYHNLDHLSNMLVHLESCRALIHQWDCILFALFYHDFVYSATAKDNEEKSAEAACKNLLSLNVPSEKITLVEELILATKTHVPSTNNDINLFTDADLSILGSSEQQYQTYYQQVRKEYSIYPDLLYKPGRKKVLKHFLEMPSIFKTNFFRDSLEAAAKRNIELELSLL